ncbi:Arylsulfatase A [Flaviramulus basaltis]|uniref:Arylsulfatase A n=1 Tax=Flaviramulus basaltis TaxID=369401 RepID=A0A1K2IMQ9_9FLAO|nr:sulfatase [Flaviramulus basaltis]SFZ93590.1 Arylsulfatase A [Flaviramulus basaltis]
MFNSFLSTKLVSVVLWFVLFLFNGVSGQTKEVNSSKKPNIIFIMTDDHASQTISAYNDIYKDVAPTPNIDRLAKEGMLFLNTFCTNSICGPSRASILTGKYSHQNGFYKNTGRKPFDGTQETFPKILQREGYNTAVIGKWHLWSEPTGFDYFKYHVLNGEQGVYWDPIYNDNGKEVQEKGYSSNLTGEFALDWLENKRDKSKPFMLMYQFKAPHRPWDPDTKYEDLFEDIKMPYPETFNDDYKTRELTAGKTMMTIEDNLTHEDLKMTPPEGLTPEELAKWIRIGDRGEYISPSDTLTGTALKKWKYQKFIKDYLACVKSVDDNIGNLLKYLDESGLAENTIVVYTSDQGFYLGDHGWFDKRFMYEESLRMPFIVRYPDKIKAGQRNEDINLNIDFAPTILDMAGIKPSTDMQGKSFKSSLLGKKNKDWRKAMYYHYYEYPKWHNVQPHYGIRTNRYKLIHFYYDVDVWELYDLKNDPNELNNIYGNNDSKALIKKLKKKLLELQKDYEDNISVEEMREQTRIGMEKY